MPFAKGKPRAKGAGRVKGTPNKKTQSLLDMCAERNYDPVLAMIDIAQDENADPAMRLQAHKEVAQYVYPKRKALEHSIDGDAGFKVVLEDYTSKK